MGTLLDLASLVMIPSGVKEDKLYSVKPTDGSGDFTFSRNSDIQATRVNSSGLIEKAKENLLLQSNSFDQTSDWTIVNNGSLTGGQTGYDGSSDAWLYTKTGDGSRVQQVITKSGLYTFSVYAKANASDWIRLLVTSGTNATQFVNLTDGSLGTNSSGTIDATATSVGSGWYRITLTTNNSAITGVRIYPAQDNNDTSGTSGSIYIQDAALCHGLVAQDYVETTTTSVVEGLTADMPRLDYSGGASCPSLLLEGSRTNAVLFSEYFKGTGWTNNRATLETNTTETLSPEGVYNATLRTNDTTTGYHDLNVALGTYSQGTITASVFAKKKGSDFLQINLHTNPTNWSAVKFNLATGEVAHEAVSGSYTTSGSIEAFADGWYRCTITSTNSASSAAIFSPIAVPLDGSAPSGDFGFDGGYTGTTSQSIYIYGYQAELNQSYPTSYIPTYGASAQRNADSNVVITSASDLIGQTEGTIFVDTTSNEAQDGDGRVQLSDGTSTSNWIFLGSPEPSGGGVKSRVYISNGGSVQSNTYGSLLSAGRHKYALAYKENDVVLYVDGVLAVSDTSATIPTCDRITLSGASPSSTNMARTNKHHQLALFKTRLSNTELAALTTI